MAIVKWNKDIITNVVSIKTFQRNEAFYIICKLSNNSIQAIEKVIKLQSARLEVTGNIQKAQIHNCGIVYGNINNCQVSNCLEVEGFVKERIGKESYETRISVDRRIKVMHGNDAYRKFFGTNDIPKTTVIHVEGDLQELSVESPLQVNFETVIFGNISYIEVGNSLKVKGIVEKAKVGNSVSCTFGKSTGKVTTKKELDKKKEQDAQLFNDLFGSIFTKENLNTPSKKDEDLYTDIFGKNI